MQLAANYRGPRAGCTFLALDDDRARRWFEFTCEVWGKLGTGPEEWYGVFFGWHTAEPGTVRTHVVALVDQKPDPAGGVRGRTASLSYRAAGARFNSGCTAPAPPPASAGSETRTSH